MNWRRFLDIDQLLVFALLAVTVNQLAHYLETFQPDGWRWIAWAQAIAIDAAIWRSAYWFRRYRGRKQRRWALTGIVAFSLVSVWYNRQFYGLHGVEWWQAWLMGAVLPVGVALLSYLHGVKDASVFAVDAPQRTECTLHATQRTKTDTKRTQDAIPTLFDTKAAHVRWIAENNGHLSRREIARQVGCAPSTVTRALGRRKNE